MPNYHMTPFQLDVETSITAGAATYSLEWTMDDFVTPGAPPPIVRATTVAAAAGSASFSFITPIRGWRVSVLSGVGTVTVEALQSGITNRN